MRFSVNIPNFGDFGDARTVASVAKAAEDAGWDALFVWDHVVHVKTLGRSFGDPWMLLTAAALATTRIKLGTLVTPVARRRPHQLARQVSTLDNLSGGRVIIGTGLGAPIEDEYGSFGEPTDPVVIAELLDEGLDLLDRYWSGEQVSHEGKHHIVRDVTLLPTPVQRPRVPVWVAGYWPNRKPMRRAARWDGVVPLFKSANHGTPPPVHEVRDLVDYVSSHRDGGGPFDVVVGGSSTRDAADVIGPLADAGATWWDERMPINSADLDKLTPIMRRIEQGPPAL
ncbi:alkanesulfonate monooxygenase SsuD/methylene tetrahydromethanopterin reductase-like flavin-dependent oxidoreductase (luciferase family) [Herbihabitans rhizosphaerae]|uniref:Alkanesulfonate monooxygenase SsuD/methylene tetrahydromethanopterin reductase-like flavin-dependent oxidoreductase (Luciferase family) n=1 Tax=Herbihabitans rhizosphaerae TaxID=1872711 RepID=A0A4V2ESA4_9PSEU|nr:LLM class flavin-dependent oxidoreductase [Herbihabitans rhizosphaerae]RZS36883.1 alkanesulfonate monooxygenase SsuD/methylene tetrahydromethanopterin reductase-like flavin-dependent oxidoreductase (luciferase family) [Herbihabitans rhizosphaerae]